MVVGEFLHQVPSNGAELTVEGGFVTGRRLSLPYRHHVVAAELPNAAELKNSLMVEPLPQEGISFPLVKAVAVVFGW